MKQPVLAVLAVLLTATAGAAPSAAASGSNDLSPFVRLFPQLPSFTEPSDQQLADLAQSQEDPNLAAGNNVGVPAGFTYFGQFIDHDLTLDTTALPATDVDPTTLNNNRTPRFDLDSVYAGGPSKSPQLYAADGKHFLVQEPNSLGARDLPRNPDGSAVLVEKRNDENQIIAQLHLAALKFHNRLIDEGHSFASAQRLTQWHYQWVVMHDYLPHVAGQDLVDRLKQPLELFRHRGYKPPSGLTPPTPIEFSVALFRYGHSQVRRSYALQQGGPFFQVFSFTLPDLRGGRPLESNRQIDWRMFFDVDGGATPAGQNVSRKLDTLISSALFQLPIPGAEASGSNVLAFRNMVRADRYGLPSGEAVAQALHIPPLTDAELGDLGPGFENGTPLWYYALAESEVREGGARLGAVTGTVVTGTFLSFLYLDRSSYLYAPGSWSPSVAHEGDFTIGDFLRFAGVAP